MPAPRLNSFLNPRQSPFGEHCADADRGVSIRLKQRCVAVKATRGATERSVDRRHLGRTQGGNNSSGSLTHTNGMAC
jgi:hypothetical protein